MAERKRSERTDTMARVGLCVACAQPADTDMMTTCDECGRTLCGHCARTITGEDVVCPDCYATLADADNFGAAYLACNVAAWRETRTGPFRARMGAHDDALWEQARREADDKAFSVREGE